MVIMNDLEWLMLSYYMVYYEKLKRIMQRREKEAWIITVLHNIKLNLYINYSQKQSLKVRSFQKASAIFLQLWRWSCDAVAIVLASRNLTRCCRWGELVSASIPVERDRDLERMWRASLSPPWNHLLSRSNILILSLSSLCWWNPMWWLTENESLLCSFSITCWSFQSRDWNIPS